MSLISLLALMLTLATCFTSCTGNSGGGDTGAPDSSSVPDESGADVSTADSTPGSTSVPEPLTDPDKVAEITFAELLMTPVHAGFADGNVAAAVKIEDGDKYEIRPIVPGTDTLTFHNNYGETATATVTVDENKKATCVVTPFAAPKNSVTVTDLGAVGDNRTDSTTAIQGAINKMSAAGGGTVYVPAGKYRVGSLSMKPYVALRLAGYLPDATVGYNSEAKKYATGKDIAVFISNGNSVSSFFFFNVVPQAYCTAGISHFSISGGMLDCQGKMKTAGFCCGEDIVFENCIIKDNPNNHAFQIEGCKDVVIRNVMFAGYNYPASGGVLTRETIQIENTTPGAIGSNYATNPIQCNDGDYFHNYGVSVIGCYFGKSDNYGSHLTAVGHHSASGGLTCDGFVFSGNVVDNPLYCGLHLLNVLNAEITDNVFISTSVGTYEALGTDSALVSLYGLAKNSSYTSAVDGKTVMFAYASEAPGNRHVVIENNTFKIGGKTRLRAVYMASPKSDLTLGASYKKSTSEYRADGAKGASFPVDGYVLNCNIIEDVRLSRNTFEITSAINADTEFAYFSCVHGLVLEDNVIKNEKNVEFSRAYQGTKGLYVLNCYVGMEKVKCSLTLSSAAKTTVTVVSDAGSTVIPTPATNATLNIRSKGNGQIDVETDLQGNLTVKVIADEGYVFSGFVDKDDAPFDISGKFTSGTTIYAVFTAK